MYKSFEEFCRYATTVHVVFNFMCQFQDLASVSSICVCTLYIVLCAKFVLKNPNFNYIKNEIKDLKTSNVIVSAFH